jgi:hypothetical protein
MYANPAKVRRVLAPALAVLMAMSLFVACGSPAVTTPSASSAAATTAASTTAEASTAAETTAATEAGTTAEPSTVPALEPIKLSLFTNCGIVSSNADKNFPFDTFAEMQRITGVELEYTNYSDEQLKVLLAGGDIGDILCVDSSYIKPMIEGDNVIALDDYLASGKSNITQFYPKRVEFSKKFFSNDTGKVYFLPASAGKGGHGQNIWNGYVVRWDYYKELGFPEIKDNASYLKVLSDMQKKHPTTEDGKKTYGMACFNDWPGLWGWWYNQCFTKGFYNWGPGGYVYTVDNGDIVNNYMDPNSPLWMTLKMAYDANKLGLFDPDSFTMKNADMAAKSKAGQYLGSGVNWWVGSFYTDQQAKDPASLAGYAIIPTDGTYACAGNGTEVGQTNKLIAITKNCKYPDRAKDFVNFLFSPECARLFNSGIQGKDWDIVDGKPILKEETIALANTGGDTWAKKGVNNGSLGNFFRLSGNDIVPSDGGPASLWSDPRIFVKQNTPVDKEFSAKYGVTYPYEAYEKKIKDGTMKDFTALPQDVPNALPIATDDIKRIDAKLDDIMMKALPKAVLAKSEAEYLEVQKQVFADLKAAGAEQSQEWWFGEWAKAKTFITGK